MEEFKVSDWVKCISIGYISVNLNEVFKIVSFKDGDPSKLQSEKSYKGGWIDRCDVIKALPHEIPNYQPQYEIY